MRWLTGLRHVFLSVLATTMGELAVVSVAELPFGWFTLAIPPLIMGVLTGFIEWIAYRRERARDAANELRWEGEHATDEITDVQLARIEKRIARLESSHWSGHTHRGLTPPPPQSLQDEP